MHLPETIYRDPVHNIITMGKSSPDDMLLRSLIDTREMQRLRQVRQLGLANFTYQGAEHSRFSHSLGVCWLATRMVSILSREYPISPENQLAVRCAALLHDIGHGPFSHVLENLTSTPHEDWSMRIITDPVTEVNQVLRSVSPEFPETVKNILAKKSSPKFLSEIITSQLDADRFDYLLRDSLMTAVKHGIFDLESILNLLRVDTDGEHIMLDAYAIHPVEKYLQARYHMFSLVYLHRTVRAAETMLRLILKRAKELILAGREDIIAVDTPLYQMLYKDKDLSLQDYLRVNDATIIYYLELWEESKDSILSNLARSLFRRRLFKSIDLTNTDDLREKLVNAMNFYEKNNINSNYYLALDEISNLPYKPYDPQNGTSQERKHIMIRTPDGVSEYIDIYDLSPVVRGLTQASIFTRRVFFPDHINGINLREVLENLFHGPTANLF